MEAIARRCGEWATAGYAWIDRPNRGWRHFLFLAGAILLLSLPLGWTGDDENYFVLAHRFVRPDVFGPWNAVFDRAGGKFLPFWLLGHLIDLLGYGAADLVLWAASIALLAMALQRLGRSLGLSPIDSVAALGLFCLGGQTLMGGEWIFGGVESKVFAHALGILAFTDIGARRWLRAAAWVVAATYLHFLVGGAWLVLALAYALLTGLEPRRAAAFVLVSILALSPLLIVLVQEQLVAAAAIRPPGAPTADYIYTSLRNAHHVAPFAPDVGWRGQAIQGLIEASAIGVGAWLLWPHLRGRARALAVIVAMFPLYIMLALAASWLDRNDGHLGKLYLFRPVSPLLLLSIHLGLAAWRRWTVHLPVARMLVLLPIVTIFLLHARARSFTKQEAPITASAQAMVAAVRALTPPGSPVLLDPATDNRAGTPRLMGRDTVVHWKFVPTNPADIYRWWTLVEGRRALFGGRCDAAAPAARWLVATRQSLPHVAKCGRLVWSNGDYALITLGARGR